MAQRTALGYIAEAASSLKVKRFSPEMVDADATLAQAASAVVTAYQATTFKIDSSFLRSLQGQQAAGKLLSSKQLAGVCNTMLLEHKLRQPEAPAAEAASTTLPPKPGYVAVGPHYRRQRAGSRARKAAYWTGRQAS